MKVKFLIFSIALIALIASAIDGVIQTSVGTTTSGGSVSATSVTGSLSNSIIELRDSPGVIYFSSYGTNKFTSLGTNMADMTTISNGTVKISTLLSVSNLTASRMIMSGADKSLSSAAASGAVPVNADGSATTFAQVQALGLSPAGVAGVMGVIPFITASTKFVPPFGATVLGATTETNCSQSMPFSCTWSNLYVRFNSLAAGTNVVVTVVTNGVASNLSISINGNGGVTTTSDTTHGVPVSAGATVSFSVLGNNASANANNVMISCGFYQ